MDSWNLHMRMLAGSVSCWPELYANVLRYVFMNPIERLWGTDIGNRHLKQRYGWIEQIEIDIHPRCDDGSLTYSALYYWIQHPYQAMNKTYKPIMYNRQTRQMLQQAGLKEVTEQVIRLLFNEHLVIREQKIRLQGGI